LKRKRDALLSSLAFKVNLRRYSKEVAERLGEAAPVEPLKPMLKAPGTKRLKVTHDYLLSHVACNFKLRRYIWAPGTAGDAMG